MKNIRKRISILLVTTIMVVLSFNAVQADSGIIYEKKTQQTITSGAILEKITRFTDSGWLNINVLRVDLSNKNIEVDAITNQSSIKTLAPVKALAESKSAVAAVNSSFFSWLPDKAYGYPDGPIVESGEIVTATSEYNKYSDSMASFSIDNLGQIMYDYWKTDITLLAPNGQSAVVGQYNKTSKDYNDFTILDKHWSQASIGSSTQYPDIVEMVVDDGKVVEIRNAQPPVQIPENGYVIVTRAAGGAFFNENFQTGDTVEMNISSTPDWTKLKMSVTGSAMLVKDGKVPGQFSFNVKGNHARTAVGSSKDGSELILATVDGKVNYNLGMTQEQMAELMISLGAYNALNLDGGGSTTMVARKPGSTELVLQNTPSDGRMRPVAAALGIFSIAPASSLDGLIIETSDSNVFVDTSREFTVKGFDRYFNPVEVDPSKVKWSVSGVSGKFKDNVFYPTTIGEGKIKASVGRISAELNISVLSTPLQLDLTEKSITVEVNQSKTINLSGKNINGYHAGLNPDDVDWKLTGNIGKIKDGVFTATSPGIGYIDAAVGGTHAYCAVTVTSGGTKPVFDTSILPKDTASMDPDNKAVTYEESDDSFRFAVVGQNAKPKNLLEQLMYVRMSEKINTYLDLAMFVGTSDNASSFVTTPYMTTTGGYESMDFKNSRFIKLDSSKNGLRASSTGQWKWFLQQLDTAKGDNIFIFLPHSQWAFTDKQETKLFQETLTQYRKATGKNIWVFFKSASNMNYIESGIKYLSTAGIDEGILSPADTTSAKYLLVTVMGNDVTFEHKTMVTQ